VAVGDYNGDGRPDLTVANLNSDNVSILLGSGTGSFGPATNFPVGAGPESVAVGDFNGDGHPDLAVANNGSDNVSILLNCGGAPPSPPTPAVPVIPEVDSLLLVGSGLMALGALAALRRRRHRHD